MARSPDPPDSHRGRQLPTGWRIVGAGAERIVERAAAAAQARMLSGDVDDTLFALECTLPTAVRGRPTVERILDGITDEVRQTWAECPRLIRDEEVERAPSRFGGLRYQVLVEPEAGWTGEAVWRAVHPVVAGAPVVTRVLLEERAGYTRVAVRVTADEGLRSVRGYAGAAQAQPGFLRALRGEVVPSWMGGPLAVHRLGPGDIRDFVHSILPAPDRDVPVAVLSPREDGGFLVDPNDLAWDLLGRARLYVIEDHRATFLLSDTIGDRRMSCYLGAARCYWPGWSRHDDPMDHPLLVSGRLADPVMREQWIGEVGLWMGTRIELPPSIDARRLRSAEEAASDGGRPARNGSGADGGGAGAPPPAEATARGAAATERPGRDEEEGAAAAGTHGPDAADLQPLVASILDEVRALATLTEQLLRSNGELVEEVERLRTISAVRSSSTNAIERRLGRLEDLLEQVFPDGPSLATAATQERIEADGEEPPAEDEGRLTLTDVVKDAAETHADALVFLESATASAGQSPYEDPERVRAILDAMARVARRRQDGVLGTSLREAFSDLGIDYRGAIAKSTSERLRQQYRFLLPDGNLVEAEEHIVLGNTYDPRRCLRIYFSSRVTREPRFVIAHVGRHFEVMTSS